MTPPDEVIYKIVPANLWSASEAGGLFAGSPADARDGFIHFSTAAQVHETAARHFAGVDGLLLVAVNVAAIPVRWERSRGGDLFPHLYGDLDLAAVRWVKPLPLDSAGTHQFPALET
jgi:uncharacterized protein (DUF952 family)